MSTTVDRGRLAAGVPPRAGRLQPDPAAAGDAPAAAQPAHGDLHRRDAGRLLPDLRAQRPVRRPSAPVTGNVVGLHHDQHGAVRRDARDDQRRGDGLDRAGRRAGAGSCGSPRCARWPTSWSRCSPRWCSALVSVLAGLRRRAALTRQPSMPAYLWVVDGARASGSASLVFAAFGLFMGYLLPTENVMQILGLRRWCCWPSSAGCSSRSTQFAPALQTIAQFTPLYGLNAAGPRAADRRTPSRSAPVAQRARLAGRVRRRRGLAVPPGHRPGLSRDARRDARRLHRLRWCACRSGHDARRAGPPGTAGSGR